MEERVRTEMVRTTGSVYTKPEKIRSEKQEVVIGVLKTTDCKIV